MVPVSQLMPPALAAVLRNAPLTPEKVAFAWRTAVGPAMDKTTAAVLRGDILHVRVMDSRWQREVERSAALVRARLDTLLGDGVVRYMQVTSEETPRSAGG